MLSDAISRIYFKKSDYDSLEELFKDVGKQLQILIKNNNSTVFYAIQDVDGVYVLEYSPVGLEDIYEDTKFPTWLDADEYSGIIMSRVINKIDDVNKTKDKLEKAKNALEDTFSDNDDDKSSGGKA